LPPGTAALPTAQALLAPNVLTLLTALLVAPGGFGLDMLLHAVPFQWWISAVVPVAPTAQMLLDARSRHR
jgi:hypothetical protein